MTHAGREDIVRSLFRSPCALDEFLGDGSVRRGPSNARLVVGDRKRL